MRHMQDEGGFLDRQAPGVDWINVLFLVGTPVAAFGGIGWYVAHYGFHWADFLLFVKQIPRAISAHAPW